jgi:integrase
VTGRTAIFTAKQHSAKGKGEDEKLEVYPFSLPELAALRAALGTYGDIAFVLGLTGLRWGELVALRVRDVQEHPRPAFRVSRSAPDNQPIRTVTKGGGARTVELVAPVWEIVRPLLTDRDPNELLPLSPTGKRMNGANWKRAAKWSTHSHGRRVHDLRHTAATIWLTSGIDVKQVQQWLGHSTATLTIDTYSHWMGSDAAAAGVAKMNALLGDAAQKAESREVSHFPLPKGWALPGSNR